MPIDDLQPVYAITRRPGRGAASDRWHAGAVQGGSYLSPEACNLDDAHVTWQTAPPAPDTPLARLCKRCFRDRHQEATA